MPTKAELYSQLASDTARRLTGNWERWADFLSLAGRLYKYPYSDQLLIYAQRPDATACAEYDVWNNRMNRFVRRGAKGIALLDDSGGTPHLRYVFDVSDTGTRRNSLDPDLWQMDYAFREPVAKMLEQTYGVSDPNFAQQLANLSGKLVEDYWDNNAQDIRDIVDGSLLEGYDDLGLEMEFKSAGAISITWLLLSRCGIDPEGWFDREDFQAVYSFSTPAAANVLGTAVTESCSQVLRQIERTIKTTTRRRNAERSQEDEQLNLFSERGLSDPGPDSRPGPGQAPGQVRTDAESVSEGTPAPDLQSDAAVREPVPAPAGGGRDSTPAAGTDDAPAGEGSGSNGGAESPRPDAVGGADEHLQSAGRGNPDGGTHQQLSFFPTEAEQIERIDRRAETEKVSAFSFSGEDIALAMASGSGFANGKGRIVAFFQEDHTPKERAEFLKNEYGIGGRSWTFLDGSHGFLEHNARGIQLRSYPEGKEQRFSWSDAAKRISLLIATGKYLDEIEQAPSKIADKPRTEGEILRETLADRGIVNGQVVEPDKLDNDPFIQQVVSDAEQATIGPVADVPEQPEPETLSDAEYARQNLIPGETAFNLDDRRFVVDRVDLDAERVSLRDVTFAQATGFPIFRSEPIWVIRQYLEQNQLEPEKPQPTFTTEPVASYPAEETHLPYDVVVERLHIDPPEQEPPKQETPVTPARNFRISDDHLGEGGPKQKFARNVEAIRTLQTLESENRNATPEEQEILSRYVGWGGLADAFDPDKDSWAKEYTQLKELLSPEEYAAARASTLNAHYTSPTVIRAIYDAVERMGFQTGNILEPSCGVGNFFGMLPESMAGSKLYGVELDSISGRIAQKLYPEANITVAGFETTKQQDFYDLAIGNVPFGQYRVNDKDYNKLGFSIHNYFFAKALDQVRPGGVVAFVTSRYTMDSKDSTARKYLAERADLLGAIRLPNNAFRANAGTDVVSDIVFLQKRDHPIDREPDWVQLGKTENGISINQYFVDHPEMVLGELSTESTQYGREESTVLPLEGVNLADQLKEAISHLEGEYREAEHTAPDVGESETSRDFLPADPNVKNFSYTVVDGEVYYRENSVMTHLELNDTAKGRVKGMVELRQIVHDLIDLQMEDAPDEVIRAKQSELNAAYDKFAAEYGLLNDRKNGRLFEDDSSYYLLCSLENLDENGKLKSKADMFTKRTIRPERNISHAATPSEALAISIGERGRVDLPYMSELLGKPGEYDNIVTDLRGVIFKDPSADVTDPEAGWQTADEYLSGNVRNKLRIAQLAVQTNPEFAPNVEALTKAQPRDREASEIDVRLGATWLDPKVIQQFMMETFQVPFYLRRAIQVNFSPLTAEWQIEGKTKTGFNDVAAYETYGTSRANGYKILEDTLNLKDVRVYDTVEDMNGKQQRVLNKKETTLAQQKQQAVKDAFANWIWKDPQRRETLVKQYNELFNSTRPREYDGSHIHFVGMNPEISLREHQKNAIAHVLYGGNTLLAHEVGAGKTFEMAASAMEAKRLGLCQKSLFVVPNHLTLQWAQEFLHLYPSAKLLVANKKDFETANRKKFCARIATGDYDAVIIGHSQFEKIPLSFERQERIIQEQIDEIQAAIAEMKYRVGERFTIKQMEKTRKGLEQRLEKLKATERKDDVVTFEQLGVDRLFVDESHSFKNLFLYTKMRNVAGLSTSEAQKSSDMFGKCRYMDEITGGRGVIFATGTPVSNSMTELYTVMRYLQYGTLQQKGLTHFDCWASTFGETVTCTELAPEGNGYRARTRFARFFNLPELMNMFKEVADIKTSDQLHLPVPEAKFETVVAKPSDIQKDMVAELSKRAAAVHSGAVDAAEDNMLCITNDGRKIGLDQRLMNPLLPDDPDSKLNACVRNVLKIWEDGKEQKLTQLLFCDLSTPKGDGQFNVYDDIKAKLLAAGVPESEVAFIHTADTEAKKKELFSKVRAGKVRVLLGSTQKMGAGTNVQDRLVAVHHLDVGWKPSDMTQRNGRIIRQGNRNKEVQVYNYVTEGTFDAYLFQTLENKQRFISQIMTSKSPVRSCEDVDEQALSYAEIKALCAGNPLIKEKMDLDIEVARLKVLKADHQSQQYRLEDKLLKTFPATIQHQKEVIACMKEDAKTAEANPQVKDGFCGMVIRGMHYEEKLTAGERLLAACQELPSAEPVEIGSYRGFPMELSYNAFHNQFEVSFKGQSTNHVFLGTDARGNITRLDNALDNFPERIEKAENHLGTLIQQRDAAQAELGKSFPQEDELAAKSARLAELDALLNMEDSPSQEAPEEGKTEAKEEGRKPSVLAELKAATPDRTPRPKTHEKEADAR